VPSFSLKSFSIAVPAVPGPDGTVDALSLAGYGLVAVTLGILAIGTAVAVRTVTPDS